MVTSSRAAPASLHRNLKLVPCCEPIPDEEWDKLREEARKHSAELSGIPTSIQNEHDDDEDEFEIDEQIAPKNISLYDTGDNSADGIDLLGADETMGFSSSGDSSSHSMTASQTFCRDNSGGRYLLALNRLWRT